MRLTRLTTLIASGMIAAVAACGGSTGGATASVPGSSGPKQTDAASAGGGAGATEQPTAQPTTGGGGGGGAGGGGAAASDITLTLTGGPDAGTYEAHPKDLTCSYGLTDKDMWGNQYSTSDKSVKFSSLQLIVPSTTAAAAGTKEFLVTVTIGEIFNGHDYEIDTQKGATGKGSGTVTVQAAPDHKTGVVTIKGTTKDNVGIDATIKCNTVLAAG
jgi:hypothetical protein